MTRRNLFCFLSIVAVNPLLIELVQGQVIDQVYGPRGVPVNGSITQMSRNRVVIRTSNGTEQSFNANEIRKINFGIDPPELSRARQQVLENRYREALEQIKQIDFASLKQDYVKLDMQFYHALASAKLALQGEGSLSEAAGFMVNFTKAPTAKDNFHFFEATEMIGTLAFAMGRFSVAEAKYAELFEAPGTEWKLRARVRVGQCQLAQEKYQEALKSFEQVAAADLGGVEGGKEQQMLATVGKAICLAGTGKPQDGIKLIEEIIKTEDARNTVLFGRAYNALGACHLKSGRKKDALLAYLHTETMFYGDPDAHAESLYHLSKLWLEVKKSDRAVKALNELKSRYANSVWASKK